MKFRHALLLAISISFFGQAPVPATGQPPANTASTDPPAKTNFIVFLTDDQGWGDLGCYGHPRIQSPHLDQFASEGLRLTQCYAACSVCSPSRSAILTGRTPYRNGVWRWIPAGSQYHLRSSEITIATILKQRGYDTCHAGKWHLNGFFNSPKHPQPNDHGYDHWLATQNNASPNHMNPTNYVRNGNEVGRIEGPSAVIAAEEAVRWLESRRDSGNPFFLTVWTHEPHLPIESAQQYMQPYADLDDPDLRQHHGNITQLDAAFGKLMGAIDRMGYRDNTLVFYTSDNGPEGAGTRGRTRGSTGGLRGRKRHSHEGGIRVPGIIRWPGQIKPGTESAVPVIGSDIFTTICDVAGVPIPTDRTIDSASLRPLFEGQPVVRRQPLYWRNHLAPENTRVALRVGDWKIIGSDDLSRFELYNIRQDWQETRDLQADHPEKFAQLKAQLIAHDAAVLAEGPDWWKDDKPRPRKPRSRKTQTREPPAGVDRTGQFQAVLGATVTPTEFGVQLKSDGEGLALRQLARPLRGSARISSSFRSTQSSGNTRNAMLVIGAEATNRQTIKLGTAIGMNVHSVFQGDWSNNGDLAQLQARFSPHDTFNIQVDLDLTGHVANVTINGKTLEVKLPVELKEVRWVGFYVKGTQSEFSELRISEITKD